MLIYHDYGLGDMYLCSKERQESQTSPTWMHQDTPTIGMTNEQGGSAQVDGSPSEEEVSMKELEE